MLHCSTTLVRDVALEHNQIGEDMKVAYRGEGAWQRSSDVDPFAEEGDLLDVELSVT